MSDLVLIIRRIMAFVIDWSLVFVLGMLFTFVGPDFNTEWLLYPSVKMFSAYGVFLSIMTFLLLPFIKDCLFKNASVGKLLTGLRIVDKETSQNPRFINLCLRNLFFYIPVLELFFLLVNKGVSLGDKITGTRVISIRQYRIVKKQD